MTSRPDLSTLPLELLWALIGLALTITGTFVEASIVLPKWTGSEVITTTQALRVTWQIGGVLLAGCMGGKNAGMLSQIAYLTLGLAGFREVFGGGSGLEYYQEPTFGYLLGLVPGAWVCGWLAFQASPKIELLTFSSLCGLVAIHGIGIIYLILGSWFQWTANPSPLWSALLEYSVSPLPGHLAIVCTVGILSYALRKLMFY